MPAIRYSRRRFRRGRKYQAWKKKQLIIWFRRFDDDKNRFFDVAELQSLFRDLSPKFKRKFKIDDKTPSEEELQFMIQAVNSKTRNNQGVDQILGTDIFLMIEKYHDYLKQKKYYDDIFDTYDANGSGRISKKELRAMMEDIIKADMQIPEQYAVVHDDDVDHVMSYADVDDSGGIEILELKIAIAEWHVYCRLHHMPQYYCCYGYC